MRAIVCDKCGKVVLLADREAFSCVPTGTYFLHSERDGSTIELCEECGDELVAAVRSTKHENTEVYYD